MVNKIVLFIEDLGEKQILLILLGITFGLRLYAVLMAKGISYDGAGYGFMARDFLRHDFAKGLSPALHPFYPFLIYLVSPDASHVEIAGRFISLFFGTMTFIPVFYLAKEVAGAEGSYSFRPLLFLSSLSGDLLRNAPFRSHLLGSSHSIGLFFLEGIESKEDSWMHGFGGMLGIKLSYKTRGYRLFNCIFLIWIIIGGEMRKGWFKKLFYDGRSYRGISYLRFPLYVRHPAGNRSMADFQKRDDYPIPGHEMG